MLGIQQLYVRRWEDIPRKWNALIDWIAANTPIKGNGVRLTRSPSGVIVAADDVSLSWQYAFQVSVNGLAATIGSGLVNNATPTISGVSVDAASQPTVAIAPAIGGGNTYIAVQVTVAKDGTIATTQDAITIVHTTNLSDQDASGGSKDNNGVGRHPIAMIQWSGNQPSRVFQITYHNLTHRFIVDAGGASRHFFFS